MKKHIKIIGLVLVAFIVGYFVGDSSATKRANEQITLMSLQNEMDKSIDYGYSKEIATEDDLDEATEKEWEEVILFEGKSIKDTETFKISSNEWRINWETEPGDMGEMNFQIYVYDKDGNPAGTFVVANIIGKGEDISYMRGSGEYYLTINTGQPYKIIIEENK